MGGSTSDQGGAAAPEAEDECGRPEGHHRGHQEEMGCVPQGSGRGGEREGEESRAEGSCSASRGRLTETRSKSTYRPLTPLWGQPVSASNRAIHSARNVRISLPKASRYVGASARDSKDFAQRLSPSKSTTFGNPPSRDAHRFFHPGSRFGPNACACEMRFSADFNLLKQDDLKWFIRAGFVVG
jgi:hypothetical protein